MFEKLFLQILNMSFTASFVILAVMAARLLLKKAPRVISYALWAVVLFRLVCPFSFESAISLLPVNANPIPRQIVYQQTPQINTGIPFLNDSVNAVLPAATPAASMNPLQGWLAIGTFLWLCGIAVLAVYSVASLLLLKRKLRGAVCESGNIYLEQGLVSPFVMGLFRPKIYLPASLDDNEKRYILLHEQTHIKRLDHMAKFVGFAALCLHWFNPLAWAAFLLCGRDMEMSCDEAVIKRLGAEVKKDYSSSLLTLATGRRIVGGSPLAFGEGDTKSRIKNVLNYKKPAFWVVVVAVVAVLAVGIGLIANPISNRASMQWAKGLQVEDIASVELVTTNYDENSRYQRYEPKQFSDIVKLVNGSGGKYLPQPEPIAGGGAVLYITTVDGVRHSVGNNGNVYLEIDGDSFEMSRFAVDAWGWYKDGNAPVPENFLYGHGKPLTLEELKTIAQKGNAVSWDDFAPYLGYATGSGLYIMHYPMAEPYYVLIGGVPNEVPMNVRLCVANTEDSIDIREESIDDFIRRNTDAAQNGTAYNGLSQDEYEELEAERVRFEAMTAEEQQILLESGGVSCPRFEHLWWEDSIDLNLIRFVGTEAFGDWARAQREQEQCSDIYSFAKQFGLGYSTLEQVIVEEKLTEIYPLERLKVRAAVFGVPDTSEEEYLAKAAPIANSYYAGQSSQAFKMLQKSIFQNWVEYDNSGALNAGLVNPKWNFDSFTQYDILDQNMDSTSDQELYYCTFLDDNGKCGYVVVSYQGESLSKIDRVETLYQYDLQANMDDITAKLGETGLDLSTAVATRVRIADENRNTAREAIRITDGSANQYLYYFDEVIAKS